MLHFTIPCFYILKRADINSKIDFCWSSKFIIVITSHQYLLEAFLKHDYINENKIVIFLNSMLRFLIPIVVFVAA